MKNNQQDKLLATRIRRAPFSLDFGIFAEWRVALWVNRSSGVGL